MGKSGQTAELLDPDREDSSQGDVRVFGKRGESEGRKKAAGKMKK